MAIKHIQRCLQAVSHSRWALPPTLATHNSGGANLEVFKVRTSTTVSVFRSIDTNIYPQFGMYIMFPIGWMYYFGVNLDTRFAVPDFWPSPETTHKIPFEREELKELSERLKADRLEKRRRRLEREKESDMGNGESGRVESQGGEQVAVVEQRTLVEESSGTFGVGSIERWARGRWRD